MVVRDTPKEVERVGGSREFEGEGCACSGEAWVSDQQGKEQWEGEIDVRGGR